MGGGVTIRPPIILTLAFGAGLATGLVRFDASGDAAFGLIIAALLLWPAARFFAGAALLGLLTALVAWQREGDQCAGRLPPGPVSLSVRVLEPAGPDGGRIAVRPLTDACSGQVTAGWPRGRPILAGALVKAEGKWIPRPGSAGRPGGIFLIRRLRPLGRDDPSVGDRVRNATVAASDRLYGSRAPMVDALVLGRRGGIDRELQDQFAASGLVHLLSISGFHVGLIGTWVFLLARLCRVPRDPSFVIAAALGSVYVAFLGWPAPATRAAALAWFLALSRARQRSVQPDALLAATALAVLLLDPWAVLDLGAWLSVAALWGATRFGRWVAARRGHAAAVRSGVGMHHVIDLLASSTGATLATAPITALALGTVAIVGIGLNLVAIPLAAVAVPNVLASLLLAPVWSLGAESLAGGAGFLLHLLELSARAGAAVPGGHALMPAEPASAIPWAIVLGVALWAMGRRNTATEATRRILFAATGCAWATLLWAWAPFRADDASGLTLHFLDVGQGDGAVLRTPLGRWVVIDAGPRTPRSDAGRRVVIPFLARHGARGVAALVVSHAHADHIGGAEAVLSRFPTGIVVEPGVAAADPLYHDFLDAVAAGEVPWHPGRPGERFDLDSVRFTLVHPDTAWAEWGEDLNEDSLVLLVEYGAFRALFAGDIGFPAETHLRGRLGAVDLLKVGHHGSRGSTADRWLAELDPRAVVVSVGENSYGHPAPETLRRLARRRIPVWRTDLEGNVSVRVHGDTMTIRGRGREEKYITRP